jgi:hypothetical protein
LRSIHKDTFEFWLYCAWSSDQQLPRVYEMFQFWGYNYMIRPSNIHGANLGLFIIKNVHVGYKHKNNSQQTTRIFPYYGLSYCSGEWRRLAEYKTSMSACGLNLSMYTHRLRLESGKEMNKCHIIYIDGIAYAQKNVAGFINSSKGMGPTIRPNCQFVEVINHRDGDMEREVYRLIMVEPIMYLTTRDELLIDYPFFKQTPVRKKREEKGLPKDVLEGRKPKNNK